MYTARYSLRYILTQKTLFTGRGFHYLTVPSSLPTVPYQPYLMQTPYRPPLDAAGQEREPFRSRRREKIEADHGCGARQSRKRDLEECDRSNVYQA